METWKPVFGYEGCYEVSDQGRVRSVNRMIVRNGKPAALSGKLLSPWMATGGYNYVSLYDSPTGKRRNAKVARLVLEAFSGTCPAGMECCHNDGNVGNDNASNLRWDTHKNNIADKKEHGTHRFGEEINFAKLTEEQVSGIVDLLKNSNISAAEIANRFNVCHQTVSCINLGSCWSHLGYSYPIRKKRVLSDEEVGSILEMREQGFSQRKIAERFGICQSTVSKFVALAAR